MGAPFKLPVFQMIVNNDDQAVLKADKAGTITDYGALTDLLPGTAGHLFKLEREFPWIDVTNLQLLAAATRVKKEVWATAVKQIATMTITAAAGGKKGDVFRLVTNSFDKTPTAYQNIPLEKRYQLHVDCADATAVGASIAAVINADENSPVTAVAAAGVVTLTQKNFREYTAAYVGDNADGWTSAWAVTTPATDWINDYENLKNYQWVTDLDFDRNAEYFPEKGAKYNSYYFKFDWTQDTGGHTVPGQKATTGESTAIVYVKQGIALDTALDALATDMNV